MQHALVNSLTVEERAVDKEFQRTTMVFSDKVGKTFRGIVGAQARLDKSICSQA